MSSNYKEAIKYYKKVVQYMEKDSKSRMTSRAEVYRYFAKLYSNAKDNSNAIKYYKKSLDASGVEYAWLYEFSR